jgi:hypothetical protein
VEVLGVPLESFEQDTEEGDGEQGDGDEGAGVSADNEHNANEDGGLDEQVVDRLMQEIEGDVELERAPEGDQGDVGSCAPTDLGVPPPQQPQVKPSCFSSQASLESQRKRRSR